MREISEWEENFRGVMRHLRKRGWRRVFFMISNRLSAPGMPGPDTDLRANNDNRRAYIFGSTLTPTQKFEI